MALPLHTRPVAIPPRPPSRRRFAAPQDDEAFSHQGRGCFHRSAASVLVLGAVALAAGPAPALAQGLEEATCLAFAGREDCRTVTVVDDGQCIVKVRPHPLPELDPAIAGCLIDEIGTKRLFLLNAQATDMAVPEDGAAGGAAAKTSVRLTGPGVAEVLAAYDENGAPVWQARNEAAFKHEGGAAETRAALALLTPGRCGKAARTASGAIPRAISVGEAYRLSAEGRIVLIDVRAESEWRETGIAATAVPITMNQRAEDFVARLRAEAGAAGETPLALICTAGVRTAWLQRVLKDHGFEGLIDVKGGMLGGDGAPGWIPAGLPVKEWEGE